MSESKFAQALREAAKNAVFYDPAQGAPKGSNADEWAVYLEYHDIPYPKLEYLACRICEALEDAEQFALERAVSRMGWKEVDAYNAEWAETQKDDDAGGYWIRCLARLFGIKRPLRCAYELRGHKRGISAMIKKAAGVDNE